MGETISKEEFQKRYGQATSQPETISKEEFKKRYPTGPKMDESNVYENAARDEEAGLLSGAKWGLENIVAPIGAAWDRYSGAPSRAAAEKIVTGHPGEALSAFGAQFGKDPELAPIGKPVVKGLGLSDKPLSEYIPGAFVEKKPTSLLPEKGGMFDVSPAGVVGGLFDFGADVTNILPAGLLLKGAGKLGAKAALETTAALGKGAAKVADVATGTELAGKAVKATSGVFNTVKDAIESVVKPKQAPTWEKDVLTAVKNGIDPSVLSSNVEFGKGSMIARGDRALTEGPWNDKKMADFVKGQEEINGAIQRKLSTFGTPLDEITAGNTLKNDLVAAKNKLFEGIDLTQQNVIQYAPGLRVDREEAKKLVSFANGLEKQAIGAAKRPFSAAEKAEARQMAEAANSLKNSLGSYKQASLALQRIGKVAFQDKYIMGQVPVDIKKMRDMYFKVQDSLMSTIEKHVNPQFADEIKANNAKMKEFFGHMNELSGALEADHAPEKLFSQLVKSGDSRQIESLRNLLPKDSFNNLRASYLKSLIKTSEDGAVLYKSTANALKSKSTGLSTMFSPKEIGDLSELLGLGISHGEPILSSSGTGASNSYRGLLQGIQRKVMDEKVIEGLKSRARSDSPLTPELFGLMPETSVPGLLEATTKRDFSAPKPKGLLKRGKIEKRLKAAQTIAPQYYDQEEN